MVIFSFDGLAFSYSGLCGFALQHALGFGKSSRGHGGGLSQQPGAKDVGVRVRVMNAVEKARWSVPPSTLVSDK